MDSEQREKKGTILMQKYELGRLLGQGTFAKVYHARNIETNQSVAIKVINKQKIFRNGLIDQIKREISVMHLVRHPNIVQLYEVMASKNKIYFAMEYVKGGELFAKVAKGKLKEDLARKYFQQLIGAVDFCHSRGVYHRDLKPENLLLDENGDLKITDFGLSALYEPKKNDGLLYTTCGTPAYVAPEVLNRNGYNGVKADIWSCGVILFVLLAGFLPFQDNNLIEMYRKISIAEFNCPRWFSPQTRKLVTRILDPNPRTRAVFDSSSSSPEEKTKETAMKVKPSVFNAFDLISLSSGFDLSGLFEEDNCRRQQARFTTTKPASTIVSKLEEIAQAERKFKVVKKDGLVRLEGNETGRKGQLGIDAEIFEVTSTFHVVEVKKTAGDTFEYIEFRDQSLKPSLKDIVWAWQGESFAANL
ncbi:hypothetical protein K1719_031877 [Acacia pycnantha]|nr:hypothetical protein K1719_031877 [Acacia pycnantha]